MKDLYEDEPIAMNGVEVKPQFVEVRDTMPFQVYLEQETVTLARQQAEHAMRNGLPYFALNSSSSLDHFSMVSKR